MPSISVIIPIYNAEKTLKRALDSVAAQTFGDWEALLINDGSTDGSERICREYCDTDPRFKLFSQENQGVSVARNLGLEKASGEYITFLDSDDALLPNYFGNALTDCQQDNLDLWIGTTIITRIDREIRRIENKDIMTGQLNNLSPDEFLNIYFSYFSLWSKMIRASVAKEFRFPTSMNWGEDQLFYLNFCNYPLRFKTNPLSVYLYYTDDDRGQSSLSTAITINRCESMSKTYGLLTQHIQNRYKNDDSSRVQTFVDSLFIDGVNALENKIIRSQPLTLWKPLFRAFNSSQEMCRLLKKQGLRFVYPSIRFVHVMFDSFKTKALQLFSRQSITKKN